MSNDARAVLSDAARRAAELADHDRRTAISQLGTIGATEMVSIVGKHEAGRAR
jgi:hypothetical protein